MSATTDFQMRLLEGRSKRLNQLIKIAAPKHMICKEVILIVQIAMVLNPNMFKPWSNNEYATATG
jgi:hypothetical protein